MERVKEEIPQDQEGIYTGGGIPGLRYSMEPLIKTRPQRQKKAEKNKTRNDKKMLSKSMEH